MLQRNNKNCLLAIIIDVTWNCSVYLFLCVSNMRQERNDRHLMGSAGELNYLSTTMLLLCVLCERLLCVFISNFRDNFLVYNLNFSRKNIDAIVGIAKTLLGDKSRISFWNMTIRWEKFLFCIRTQNRKKPKEIKTHLLSSCIQFWRA